MQTKVQKEVEDEMSREEFHKLFVDVLKICQPEHPYYSGNPYEGITTGNITTTFCREDSPYYARCGPRRKPYVAKYSIDLEHYRNISFTRALAITTHEVTHIPIGRHNGRRAPAHPPEFWNEMAYHAQCVIDAIPEIEEKWETVHEEDFRRSIINDPNRSMVDQRSESVSDVKNRLVEWVGNYGDSKF